MFFNVSNEIIKTRSLGRIFYVNKENKGRSPEGIGKAHGIGSAQF